MNRARAALFAIAIAIAGCPPRDLILRVSETGISAILTSCRGVQKTCMAPGACVTDPQVCEMANGACVLRGRCHIGDAAHPAFDPTTLKEAKLVLFDLKDDRIAAESPCVVFDPSKCLVDRACLAAQINDLLDKAIPSGLTFGGFQAQEDALLTLAIYEPSMGVPLCDLDRLVGCASFAPPLGGGDYDITCASCQDSVHFAIGPDNGPCPTTKDECFLQRCDRMLRTLPGP